MEAIDNAHAQDKAQCPSTFEQVLDFELTHLKFECRKRRDRDYPSGEIRSCDSPYAEEVIADAHAAKLSGIALSGGGIRSATFNLGVLQALASLDVLKEFDYLSTVSGGGYIGSWLTAWIHRESAQPQHCDKPQEADRARHTRGFCPVNAALAASVGDSQGKPVHGAMQPDPGPIAHLREYSNYLTPRLGFFSSDTWTFAVAYLRNLTLTLGLLSGAALTLVFFMLAAAYAMAEAYLSLREGAQALYNPALILFFILVSVASLLMGYELAPRRTKVAVNSRLPNLAIALAILSAAAGALWLSTSGSDSLGVVYLASPPFLLASLFGFFGRWLGNRTLQGDVSPEDERFEKHALPWLLAGAAVSLLALVLMMHYAAPLLAGMTSGCSSEFVSLPNLITMQKLNCMHIVVWGVPVFVLIYYASLAVYVGVAGSAMRDLDREWLARFFGVFLKWTLAYTLLMALIVYSSNLIDLMPQLLSRAQDEAGPIHEVLASLWAALSAAGVVLAHRSSGQVSQGRGRMASILIAVAPWVFVVGLLVIMSSVAIHALQTLASVIRDLMDSQPWLKDSGLLAGVRDHQQTDPENGHLVVVSGYWLLALAAALTMLALTYRWSSRIGVNEFSLHALYGNRLIRAYLGASNINRHAHPFTGFDYRDNDTRLHELACQDGRVHRPYPIINAAINLVSSRRLAWQKRKAASFVFTPKFCGYEFCEEGQTAHACSTHRTGGYADSERYGSPQGMTLGKAMTISGAALSPNMGYHTSPGLAFLMTVFNLRLGWWLPNSASRNPEVLSRKGPGIGLLYLLTEAFGLTDAQRDYIYLSDGGHFENLGVYELVRRRCKLVLVCDAEADPHLVFSGLGNAIEKCRTDLGVPINLDVAQVKREIVSGKSRWHCSVGCIRYSEADPGHHDGVLVYLKASLTGDEPRDVETYSEENAEFPHEPTADQWFNESQFEGYRELGEHIAMKVLGNAVAFAKHALSEGEDPLERVFLELRKQWYPHSEGTPSAPVDHDAMLQTLLERLRTDANLSFLDSQLYPNLQRISDEKFPPKLHLIDRHESGVPDSYRIPRSADELRAGFYYCKELLQFMQRVFHDCRLDTESFAPSNRGWMNLFRRWSLSRMFRYTWAMTAGTYSARFQSFCEFQLLLDSGTPSYGSPIKLRLTVDDSERTMRCVELSGVDSQSSWTLEARKQGMRPYECVLIEEFIAAYANKERVKLLRPVVEFELFPFKIAVEDAFSEEIDKEVQLYGGFLIVAPHPEHPRKQRAVVYFRIRSSMRNMDLARKAFIQMRRDYHLSPLSICLTDDLPDLPLSKFATAQQRRAYREVHNMDRDDVERCRWFSQLLQEKANSRRI